MNEPPFEQTASWLDRSEATALEEPARQRDVLAASLGRVRAAAESDAEVGDALRGFLVQEVVAAFQAAGIDFPEQAGGGPGGDDTEQCEHADQPHTVWWWNEQAAEHMPIPDEARFDNQADALAAARKLIGNPSIVWIKVFRSDNESYTCWRWNREEAGGKDQ